MTSLALINHSEMQATFTKSNREKQYLKRMKKDKTSTIHRDFMRELKSDAKFNLDFRLGKI